MTNPPLQLLDSISLAWDNSTYKLTTACPTMGNYKILHKREKAGVAIERDVGKTAHTALEYRYKTFGAGPVSPEGEAEMLRLFELEYNQLGDIPEDTYLTLARVKQVLVDYNKTYGREPFEVLAVEVPFAVPLGEVTTLGKTLPPKIQVIWTGRSDLLTRYDNGEVFTHDHKFTKQWGPMKSAQFETDEAQQGYAWAVAELARLHPNANLPAKVNGFTVSGIIMRPELKRATKENSLPRNEFVRERFYWTAEQLTEWRTNVLTNIETWLWHYERVQTGITQDFPRNLSQCANYYGKKCGYWETCRAKPSQRPMVLGMDLYKNVTWEPLHRVE